MTEVADLERVEMEFEQFKAELHNTCKKAGVPEWADQYLARHMPLDVVLSDCLLMLFGRRLPSDVRRLDA